MRMITDHKVNGLNEAIGISAGDPRVRGETLGATMTFAFICSGLALLVVASREDAI